MIDLLALVGIAGAGAVGWWHRNDPDTLPGFLATALVVLGAAWTVKAILV